MERIGQFLRFAWKGFFCWQLAVVNRASKPQHPETAGDLPMGGLRFFKGFLAPGGQLRST